MSEEAKIPVLLGDIEFFERPKKKALIHGNPYLREVKKESAEKDAEILAKELDVDAYVIPHLYEGEIANKEDEKEEE